MPLPLDRRIVLHIGTHKTGTTSIQHFLASHAGRLRTLGRSVYVGHPLPENHVELHTAALRRDRPTPFKMASGIVADHAYRAATRARVAAFLLASAGTMPIFSAEGLSFLRHRDELERLDELIGHAPARVIAYCREPNAFRDAYAATLARQGIGASADREAFNYLDKDSWLFDYPARLAPFRAFFGAENVEAIDYDAVTSRDGSVIPSFLDLLGIRDAFAPGDWAGLRLNARQAAERAGECGHEAMAGRSATRSRPRP